MKLLAPLPKGIWLSRCTRANITMLLSRPVPQRKSLLKDLRFTTISTQNRSLAAVLPIVQELEKHPIVAYVEDPIVRDDIDSWRRLREQSRIPIVMHVPQLGGVVEVINGLADAYMVGESGIGEALAKGFAYGKANIQTIIQLTGGTLTKALALHLGAVLPTMTGHSINLDDQYEEDITTERIPIINGASPVPERPGLGYDVDEDALARVAANKPTVVPRHVGILHLPNGQKLYTPSFPSVSRITGREGGGDSGNKLQVVGRRWIRRVCPNS